MRSQPPILQLFARKDKEQRPVTFLDVARELGITDQAAVSALERLWQHRLITPTTPRRFQWRQALPGTQVRDLAFRLTARGRERLEWWAKQDHQQERGGGWPF